MAKGEALFKAVKKKFFADFRVSVMLDSNGSNTTAAAGVAVMAKQRSLAGKKAVVLAGTGPVGMRAAVMLAREGATVALTSRKLERAQSACAQIQERFGLTVTPVQALANEDRARALEGAHVCFATGAAAVQLLEKAHWQSNPTLELIADANATPPLGVDGVEMFDKAKDRDGKVAWGAIGFGALKLAVHRACIGRLFEANDLVFDAEEIYAVAKEMA
jgi:threonine dehydrogenase-like Zn-dependent dehydrogenase